MEDKEIGEMWKYWCPFDLPGSRSAGAEICALIRKLVEERAKGSYWHRFPATTAFHKALEDFGINPNDYEKPS